jgi:hypothetical protein
MTIDPEAEAYLRKLNTKINTLVERFAEGDLNRRQFENLHKHYRREIEKIERVIAERISPAQWKRQMADGQTMLIRRLNAARMVGFSIYDTHSKQLLASKGDFSNYEDTVKRFILESDVDLQPTGNIELKISRPVDHAWVCVLIGKFSTAMILLTEEPSQKQIHSLVNLHGVFESANRNLLTQQLIPNHLLAIPHNFYIGKEL